MQSENNNTRNRPRHLSALCETHMNTDRNISINGYRFINRCRKDKCGGGIGLLIKKEIIQNITIYSIHDKLELMWICMETNGNKPVFMGLHYAPQKSRST